VQRHADHGHRPVHPVRGARRGAARRRRLRRLEQEALADRRLSRTSSPPEPPLPPHTSGGSGGSSLCALVRQLDGRRVLTLTLQRCKFRISTRAHRAGVRGARRLPAHHEEVDRMMHSSPSASRAGSRPGPVLGRRSLLQGAGALAALGGTGALAGCAGTAARASDEIAFWHLLSGPDGVTMAEMLDGYMATEGAAQVRQTVLAWGAPYYTKLAMASSGGRAPDLAVMHAARVPGYAPGGLLDEWDLDLLGEFGIRQEDFPELIWDKMIVDGKLTC